MVAACGGDDNGFDSCDVDEDCESGYSCSSGVCRFRGTGSGGDDVGGGDGITPGDSGGGDSGGDSGGGDGGDNGGGTDEEDLTGPTITNFEPAAATRGVGIMTISADIVDSGSGVDPVTVVAIVGATPTSTSFTTVPLSNSDGDTYTATFDTSTFKPGVSFPYLEIAARDRAGNISRSGHSILLDATKPLISFTSPAVQAINAQDECSQPFFPLGDGSGIPWHFEHGRTYDVNSYQIVPRLRLEDRGNATLPVPVYAGILPESVKMYITPVSATASLPPLLLPETAGGTCAVINPDLIPEAGVTRPTDAYVLDFQPVEAGGAPFFQAGNGAGLACTPSGSATEAPDPPCDTAGPEGIQAWKLYGAGGDIAIWVADGYDTDFLLTCTGMPFDFGNLNGDGTFCAAATATDLAGNVAVTEPVIFCVDGPAAGNPCTGVNFTTLRDRCVQSCTYNPQPFGTAVQTYRLE